MAKVITQQTFDDVVKENIVDFSMSAEDARLETIEQFEAQGINLANIIKDLSINEETGLPLIGEAIESLRLHVSGEILLNKTDLIRNLKVLSSESDKSVPHRVLAANSGALQLLITISDNYVHSKELDTLEVILLIFNISLFIGSLVFVDSSNIVRDNQLID